MKENGNAEGLGRIGRFLGRLLWVCVTLLASALVVLVIYGLCALAVALDRGEAWAEWVAGILFVTAFMLMVREINK